MNWPSCRLKQVAKNPFAIQLPLSFERALQEATANVKAQKQEFDFNKEILRFRTVMMNRAMAKLQNTLEAKEWVQQAYLKALEANYRRPWEPKSTNWQNDLSAWLCRIVDNEITSHFRKKREFIEPENCNLVAHGYNIEREDVDYMLNDLPEHEREVIEYSMEGLNNFDISRLSGAAFKAVQEIKKSGMDRIRRRMQ